MAVTISIREDQVIDALRSFLLRILPAGVEVFRGQDNRVPEPIGPDYVVMWPVSRTRMATNVDTWTRDQPATVMDAMKPTHLGVQLDIHGPDGADNAGIVNTLFRDDYALGYMDPDLCVPLYTTDGRQVPFINGEQQYEDRWVMEAMLQINPVVSTTQPFADTLVINMRRVEPTQYPRPVFYSDFQVDYHDADVYYTGILSGH